MNPVNDVIWLSNICFEGQQNDNASFFIIKENQKFLVCNLNKHKSQTSLDLYFLKTENIKFEVQGQGKVHLSGYCEPSDLLSQEPEMEKKAEQTQTVAQSKKEVPVSQS